MVDQKEDKKTTKKATFVLDKELHKKLRLYAVMKDTTMVDIVEKALKDYLKRNM